MSDQTPTDAVKNAMPFSATRIQTALRCERKFAWEKICGYEDPGTDATDFGQRVHDILEQYKKHEHTGAVIDRMTEEGAVAAEALPHVADLSLADGVTSIEGEFIFQGRHRWRGKIDIERPGDLRDYKTTSDFRYAKTEEELQHDAQAVLYAERMFRRMEATRPVADDEVVQGTWIYLRKRRPHASRTVKFTMTRAHARRMFEILESVADHLQALASGAPDDPAAKHRYVLDVAQPNEEACHDFGRPCPHSTRCNLAFFTNPTPEKSKYHMGLLERLQAQNAFNGPANETPAVALAAPAVAPAAPAAPAVGAQPVIALPAWATAKVDPLHQGRGNPHPMGARIDIPSTPVAPPRPAATQTLRELAAAAPPLGDEPAPRRNGSGPLGDEPTVPSAEVAPGQVNPPKRGRGRPRKDAGNALAAEQTAQSMGFGTISQIEVTGTLTAPAPAPAPAPAAPVRVTMQDYAKMTPAEQTAACDGLVAAAKAPAPAPAPAPATLLAVPPKPTPPSGEPIDVTPRAGSLEARAAAPSSDTHRITTLFVGCMPRSGQTTDFDSLVAKAKVAIGPQDYRLFEFGKGNGLLLQMFQAIVQHEKPTSLVVISSMSPEAVLCLSHLRSISDIVVEAVR